MAKKQKVESLYDNYDNLIIKCIPNYPKILQTMTDKIDSDKGKMLDIGIGTGNLEEFIFRKFPKARITGVDTSIILLNKTKLRFSNQKFQAIQADIRNYDMGKNKFSKILASLAIHHFEDEEKRKLFQNIYEALSENGSFINFDMIKPETEKELLKLKKELFQKWKDQGLTKDFIEKEKEEMAERDRLVELSKQKEWLEKIGFTFHIIYDDGFFCVYLCKK